MKVQVTEVYGLNFCQAEVIQGDAGEIRVGDLFEIDRWAASREARMRVWIPGSNLSRERLLRISREIGALKNSNHIGQIKRIGSGILFVPDMFRTDEKLEFKFDNCAINAIYHIRERG